MTFLPLAHAVHYAWVLFVPPALVVLWSIVGSVLEQRRQAKRTREDGGDD